MSHEHLTIERFGSVLTMTINSAHKLNVMDPDILLALTFTIHNAQTNPDVKAIVIVIASCSETEYYQLDHTYSFRTSEHSFIQYEAF